MPGHKFTKSANTPERDRQWDHVYQAILAKTGSHRKAVIEANGVLKHHATVKKGPERKQS